MENEEFCLLLETVYSRREVLEKVVSPGKKMLKKAAIRVNSLYILIMI